MKYIYLLTISIGSLIILWLLVFGFMIHLNKKEKDHKQNI